MNKTNLSGLVPILLIGGLFFMFGFITWLNGSLIPFLQIACELNQVQAYLVTLAFYITYALTALPMSAILFRTGYKNGLILGLFIMAVGSLIFIPAALWRTYSIFLAALFVLGTGLTILQTAVNPYVVMIGPRETAAVRISIMGVLNKGAGVIAPLVFTAFVFSDVAQFDEARLALLEPAQRGLELEALSARLIKPYLMLAGLLLALAAYVWLSPLPEPADEEQEKTDAGDGKSGILHQPQLVLGAVTLFFYVGAEVIAGDTIGLFGKETGVRNFSELTSYTMGFMVIGYVLGILAIPRWLSQQKALTVSATLGICLVLLLVNASAESSVIWNTLFGHTGVSPIPDVVLYVALFGLSNAMVWPVIWPLALSGLNRKQIHTGSALLIMAIGGGAVLPLIYGAMAEYLQDLQSAYWVMLPCYLLILLYAVKGHKLKQWRDTGAAKN
ncbi:MAG: sugar MFS transporter [Gammaproteobacteria bacterium]|nr:sugar MFS transporter [Gammaproteobacteria bacterium]MCY4210592.1 sugar MFS transporter [Gammaproteobacteria bacterium]MCY4283652.1 sugar MFS transporter [Gammaproteobacteria bacterium]MCY4339627.1 sugar MFS transporter [Gammaproteobacteria bacterium]